MTSEAGAEDPRRRISPNHAAVALFLVCIVLSILDSSSINVALAAIGHEFEVPVAQTSVINIGFLVTVAAVIPMSGWLGERFGLVRLIVASLVVFSAGAIVSATAADLGVLTVGRVIQGLGGGGIGTLAMSHLYRAYPPEKRLALGPIMSLPLLISPTVGPLLGGALVQYASWRWIFLLNLPLAVFAIVIALRYAVEKGERSRRPLDVLGAVLTVLGFGGFALALNSLSRNGIDLTGELVLGGAFVLLIALWGWELRLGERAFLDLALFRIRPYSRTVLITAIHSVAFFGGTFLMPVALQSVLGLSPLLSGAVTACGAIGTALIGRPATRLILRIGARAAIVASQTSMLLLAGVMMLGFWLDLVPLIAVAIVGYSASSYLTVTTAQNVGFGAVPHRNIGDASSLLGASRQMASAAGVALVAGVLAFAGTGMAPGHHAIAPVIAYAILGVFHLAAALLALFSRDLPLPGRDK
ncbi:MAG TPA: MFS transporter [Microbacterium sp.]|nr:MFS transporter [Microbacterium sp.]